MPSPEVHRQPDRDPVPPQVPSWSDWMAQLVQPEYLETISSGRSLRYSDLDLSHDHVRPINGMLHIPMEPDGDLLEPVLQDNVIGVFTELVTQFDIENGDGPETRQHAVLTNPFSIVRKGHEYSNPHNYFRTELQYPADRRSARHIAARQPLQGVILEGQYGDKYKPFFKRRLHIQKSSLSLNISQGNHVMRLHITRDRENPEMWSILGSDRQVVSGPFTQEKLQSMLMNMGSTPLISRTELEYAIEISNAINAANSPRNPRR